MEDHFDFDSRKISKEEGEAVKPTRSFRYEDYSTRRVFLRSYPLQWDWSPAPEDDEKHGLAGGATDEAARDGNDGDERCGGGRGWKRQVVEVVVEWGEDKLLLLRRAKKRLALYLLGCGRYGSRPALSYRSGGGGSYTASMLTSR
ncbi:unnamed protein product [Urochloa decumbens]|uniref:Uncharacterized protein n=1 Tax=Urochloa decumbens TaxID=240449 RepID=A0ABC9DZE4_9POAL